MKNMVKIGSGWVFCLDNLTGYDVLYKGRRPGDVILDESFSLRKNEEGKYAVTYYKEVPVGVVRRALHTVKLYEKKLLDN